MNTKSNELELPWLNEPFLKRVLQNEPENTGRNIKIHKFNGEFATKNGDNYSSLLYRVHVNYSIESQPEDVNKSYIVKYMHPLDTSHGATMKSLNVFNKEVWMYTETLPVIHDAMKAAGLHCQLTPRYLYHTTEPYELLVLEDLVMDGYQMADRRKGFNLARCNTILAKLAKMHAVSMFLNKQDPKFRAKYNLGIFQDNMSDTLKVYFENGISQAVELMKSKPELQKYVKFYENYLKCFIQHGIDAARPVPEDCFDFNVLVHGDFWINNMMFKYNDDGSLDDLRFVDLQQPFFSSPGYDLNYFFFTSTTDQTRSLHRDDILKEYHNQLTETLVKLKYTGTIPKLEYLYQVLLKNRFIAIMTPCIVLPLVKLDETTSDNMTADAIMDNKESAGRNALFSNLAYHEALVNSLNDLEKIGFLDKFD